MSPSTNKNEFSYHNDQYRAKLDHCIIPNSLYMYVCSVHLW